MVNIYLVRHAESSNNTLKPGDQRTSDPLLTERGRRQAEALSQYLMDRRKHHLRPADEGEEDNDVKPNIDSVSPSLPGSGLPWKFDRIFVSPMTRTLMTAAPLLARLSVDEDDTTCPSVHVIPTIFENGGCFLGSRKSSITEVPPSDVRHGLNRDEILKLLRSKCLTTDDIGGDDGDGDVIMPIPPVIQPKLFVDPGCTEDRGWWKGGKETDQEYLTRCFLVVDWLWEQDKDCMVITHGIFMDTLTRILLNLDNIKSLRNKSGDSEDTELGHEATSVDGKHILNLDLFDSYFLTGNVCISCFHLDPESKKTAVCFINQPVIKPEIRSGHKLKGLCLRDDAW